MTRHESGFNAGRQLRLADDTAAVTFVTLAQADMIDDGSILERADLFPVWDEHWTGKAGSILQDEGDLFRSIHDVGTGQNTKPSATPSMWTMIGNPADEYPEWYQPLGAHDAYGLGDKVTHSGKKWISTADANTWEPGVYGWDEAQPRQGFIDRAKSFFGGTAYD